MFIWNKRRIIYGAMISPLLFCAFSCVPDFDSISGFRSENFNFDGTRKEILENQDVGIIGAIIDQKLSEFGFFVESKKDSNRFLLGNVIERKYKKVLKDNTVFCNVMINRKSISIGFYIAHGSLKLLKKSEEIRELNKEISLRLRQEYKYLPMQIYPIEEK